MTELDESLQNAQEEAGVSGVINLIAELGPVDDLAGAAQPFEATTVGAGARSAGGRRLQHKGEQGFLLASSN